MFCCRQQALNRHDELIVYFDGVFFLREIGEEKMLGVEAVRCRHGVQLRVDNIKFVALIVIEVGAAIPCVQCSGAPRCAGLHVDVHNRA